MTTLLSTSRPPRGTLGRRELTWFLALSMALAALGIDVMLPAFGAIREGFGLPETSTAVTGVLTTYFLGLAAGQLLYGPIADRFGRKPTLGVGYAVYGLGALASALAPTLPALLAARFLWGIGAAGPRVVTQAVIRDTFEGEEMSRAMSMIMAVFILVPVIAPTMGAAVITVVSWRWLFAICVAAVLAVSVWSRRLQETLREEHRIPQLRFGRIAQAARLVVSNRQTVAYSLAMTFLWGAFTGYLGSSEIIVSEVYGLPTAFPVVFGGLALFMGAGMLVNARVVRRLGVRRLAHGVLVAYIGLASVLAAIVFTAGGRPPFPLLLAALAAMLLCQALLVPNLNTIAMTPMAAIAGTAASVVGSVQIALGAT
ncbi:MAG TPA: Bcr/CflA family efflux MFS transporter, partial [Egibacteraceae bacterium]|nr:Bcr/CflA family efflux MFS transporter [Egibacteraceae bacterium]